MPVALKNEIEHAHQVIMGMAYLKKLRATMDLENYAMRQVGVNLLMSPRGFQKQQSADSFWLEAQKHRASVGKEEKPTFEHCGTVLEARTHEAANL